jgi:predicted nucleotidyltransferase
MVMVPVFYASDGLAIYCSHAKRALNNINDEDICVVTPTENDAAICIGLQDAKRGMVMKC